MNTGFKLALQPLLQQNPRKEVNDVISVLTIYCNNLDFSLTFLETF